ncbi:DUF4861 family protein [Polaribacter marinaquae]|uniref:DUF4861 family protein n=1 Tax=Polaribacter marinaquae TaxID=1642819 RepID=A0ABZ2TQP1_9FLAO
MKKLAILSILFFAFYACKKNSETPKTSSNSSTKTYAEISMAQGGEWVDGPRNHKEYKNGKFFKNVNKVNVPQQHTDHTWYLRYEGPGWENNKVGYRLYLDWRNAIDVFGKKVDSLVLPYVGQDGFDSYHEPSAWGQDILKAGKSMGIGGFGRLVLDTIVHFQKVEKTIATIENTEKSSAINIHYKNWKSGNDSIDLKAKLAIFSEDRFTKASLTPSKEISGLSTGIVIAKNIPVIKKEGAKWAYIATYGKQTLANPPDNLGMALFYNLDDVDSQTLGQHDHLVTFKPTTKTITYYFLAAWEQELNGIKTEEEFLKDINKKLASLEATNNIN